MTEIILQLQDKVKLISTFIAPVAVILSVYTYLRNAYNRRIDNAITFCDRFAKNVLPAYQKYKVDTVNIDKLSYQPGLIIHQMRGLSFYEGQLLDDNSLKELSDQDVYAILNELEIIAIAIDKKVLDVRTAKSIIGPFFCERVEVYAPIILSIRSENKYAFSRCLKVYKKWRQTYITGVTSPLNSSKEGIQH